VLITLSGLDGAGKSTVAEWLRAELERGRRPAMVLHMNDHVGVYAWLKAVRDRVRGRSSRDDPPRMDPSPTVLGRLRDALVWSRNLRRLLFPLDVLIFVVYRAVVEKAAGRVLIMDRYFYDRLVDVADGRAGAWMRLLARLTPVPDLPVLLTIPPEEAFARKGEYTVDYLRRRDAAYRQVFPGNGRSLRLDAHDLERAKLALRMNP
jgi:thymidylate kinase